MTDKKKCTLCKLSKLLTLFSKRKRSKDGHQNVCKECSEKRSKKYYRTNRVAHKKKTKAQRKVILKRNYQFTWDYLLAHPCVDCGNSNPIVLEFDHVSGEKIAPVSVLVHDSWSLENIQNEINKCEVRCANCHRIKTSKDFGWYKNINTGSVT